MKLKTLLRRWLNPGIHRLGYEIVRYADSPTYAAALHRAAERGVAVNTVIDAGASDGRWSAMARRHWPNARYLLVDANPVHAPALQAFKNRHPGVDFEIVAAGDRDGSVYFDAAHAFIGIASHASTRPDDLQLPMRRLDTLVAARALPPPYLLKLDTHGFEAPILEGARQTLAQTQLIAVEVYNFRTSETCLRFHEICAYLEARGFRPVDLCEPIRRFRDGVLWQFDLLFAPAASFATEATIADAYQLFGFKRIPGQTDPTLHPLDDLPDRGPSTRARSLP